MNRRRVLLTGLAAFKIKIFRVSVFLSGVLIGLPLFPSLTIRCSIPSYLQTWPKNCQYLYQRSGPGKRGAIGGDRSPERRLKELVVPRDFQGRTRISSCLRAPRLVWRDQFAQTRVVDGIGELTCSGLLCMHDTYRYGDASMQTGTTLSWFRRLRVASFALITAIGAVGLLSASARVATGEGNDVELGPLSSVAVPMPIGGDIVDQAAAVRLGKALFWDIQLGGDGQTACATCHFHGGADNRPAINPGLDKLFGTADDVHGSMGLTVAQGTFKNIDPNPDNAADICTTGALNLFGVAPQVTTRNAPTTVNGVAFFRQMFWDGRGNDNFNCTGPFGQTANNTAAQKTSAAFSAV